MPAIPVGPVLGEDVVAAQDASKKRAYLSAANYAGQQQLEEVLQLLQQQGQTLQQQGQTLQQQGQTLQRMQAQVDNMRRRAHNRHVWNHGGQLQLQPLHREARETVAGGAAAGDLPAQGVFPADRQALNSLTGQQLDALQEFYGEPFAGPSVAARREAFVGFVTG